MRVDVGSSSEKFLFDHMVKVCRNTNMVFSPYDSNGMDKIRMAFLGNLVRISEEDREKYGNHTELSVKRSSCTAMTRYEYDSQNTEDLSLTKGRYFVGNAARDGSGTYMDTHVAEKFNSYDSLDKFVMVLDFDPSVEHRNMFEASWQDGVRGLTYNILGDAGFIPHFAYQSLVRYGSKDGGTAYTWKNSYLDRKSHMQFELLGIDDSEIPTAYDNISRMVVEDLTDNCKTLVCPAKMVDDIYRIWCEGRTYRRRPLPGEPEDPYCSYFENEYRDYPNPELDFGGSETIEWTVDEKDAYELEVPRSEQEIDDIQDADRRETRRREVFKTLLDEYYVSVMRTKGGHILNEKRYLLPPTRVSSFFFGTDDGDGYIKCSLSPY